MYQLYVLGKDWMSDWTGYYTTQLFQPVDILSYSIVIKIDKWESMQIKSRQIGCNSSVCLSEGLAACMNNNRLVVETQ